MKGFVIFGPGGTPLRSRGYISPAARETLLEPGLPVPREAAAPADFRMRPDLRAAEPFKFLIPPPAA